MICIVPARMASQRFPGKPLSKIEGEPMVVHTLRRAQEARFFRDVVCATEDQEIAEAVKQAGFSAILTPSGFRTGSDRIAWAARELKADRVVNLQGDEPLANPETLRKVAQKLKAISSGWVSAYCELQAGEYDRPSAVKVRVQEGLAQEFFRESNQSQEENVFKHIGIYGYGPGALEQFARSAPTNAEEELSLEQLRVFPGTQFAMVPCSHPAPSVDVPEDLKRIRALWPEPQGKL